VSPLLIKRREGKKETLIKRGEFFIIFPSPSQGEGGGGVHSLIG
jgi:hypothetical protein